MAHKPHIGNPCFRLYRNIFEAISPSPRNNIYFMWLCRWLKLIIFTDTSSFLWRPFTFSFFCLFQTSREDLVEDYALKVSCFHHAGIQTFLRLDLRFRNRAHRAKTICVKMNLHQLWPFFKSLFIKALSFYPTYVSPWSRYFCRHYLAIIFRKNARTSCICQSMCCYQMWLTDMYVNDWTGICTSGIYQQMISE